MTDPTSTKRAVRRLAGRVRRRLGRHPGSSRRTPGPPRLSVVVPVYNVEKYLAECLDAVLAQTYPNLEVVLVDDGSTDASGAIAQRYVDAHPNITLVQQANAGLGAARNTGVRHVTGDFLVFLDSDDTVPPDAYTRMMSVLQESGSDFVVGSFMRQYSGVYREPVWMRRIHAQRRVAVTIEDEPDALANVFAWNKIFRRDFWDRAGLAFPEGVRYEDQVPMTQAYLDADRFDMVSAVVYRWRTREDGTSITQQKADARDLRDRLVAKRDVARMLAGHGSGQARTAWYAKVLTFDFPSYYRVAVSADADYWNTLSSGMRELLDTMDEQMWAAVPLQYRVLAWLVSRDRRAETAQLLDFLAENKSGFPVRRVDGERYAELPVGADGESGVPGRLLRLEAADSPLQSRLLAVAWDPDGSLTVRGAAFLPHVESARSSVSLSLRERRTHRELPAAISPQPDRDINAWAGRDWEDHAAAGFVARVDVPALVASTPARRRGSGSVWEARLVVSGERLTVDGAFRGRSARSVGSLCPPSLVAGSLVHPRWMDKAGLCLEVSREGALARSATVSAHELRLGFDVTDGSEPVAVLLRADERVLATGPARPDADGGWTASVSLPRDGDDPDLSGQLEVRFASGRTRPVLAGVLGPVTGPAERAGVMLTPDADGRLRAVPAGPTVTVEEVALDGDDVVLSGGTTARTLRLLLSGPRFGTEPVTAEIDGARFRARIGSRAVLWQGRPPTRLPSDRYVLAATDEHGGTVPVTAAPRLGERSPLPLGDHDDWTVEVEPKDLSVHLRLGTGLRPEELGRFNQRRLVEEVYRPARNGPRSDVVLFECFNGQAVGDSPGAICEALGHHTALDRVWGLTDPTGAPPGARAVRRFSREWYATLGSAAYLVSNNNFPSFFRKAPGQVHLQTWHGTPLKRIGHDVPSLDFVGGNYLALMDAEAAGWDYLLSPSPYCSEIFPHAFAYSGPLLEHGYPRNDLLVSPEAESTRARVRKDLGIEEHQTVILYAPTWRETVRVGTTYEKVVLLDPEELVDALPDAVVLVRGHANTARRPSTPGRPGRVRDVTLYPEVAELYLAADVLVTDYSSVMFDFALTDRPMYFLVPDLESYRDSVRGFYLDFEETVPGPVLRTTGELVRALTAEADGFAERRRVFRDRFCPWDDGNAARRVVTEVFGT